MERVRGQRDWRRVKLFNNGEDTKRNVVRIAVAESLKNLVAAVQNINDRIQSMRLDYHVRARSADRMPRA